MIEKILERLEAVRQMHFDLSQSDELNEHDKGLQRMFVGCYRQAKEIVQEVAKEYEEKKLCRISLVCLEDTTSLEMELTEQEYLFLERVTDAVNKIAVGCMPTMYVEQKGE